VQRSSTGFSPGGFSIAQQDAALRNMGLGSEIQDPEKTDPGSGSATLPASFRENGKYAKKFTLYGVYAGTGHCMAICGFCTYRLIVAFFYTVSMPFLYGSGV
jgi:hypothetical protein